MKTLLEILHLSSEYLAKQGVTNPRREAELLLCDFLKVPRMDIYLNYDRPFEEKELSLLRARLKRRILGEPLAYISGEVAFYGCTITVNPSVLIPRQETEILVDLIAQMFASIDLKGKKLLDLCTGSGCIGLALKKKCNDLDVTLSDISQKALEVAEINAQRNQLTVKIVQGDLLKPFLAEKFDYIVCNPPYVSLKEYSEISHEVSQFEPALALIGGETGLDFYMELSQKLPSVLNPFGKVFLEIGAKQGESIKNIFNSTFWKSVTITPDWAKHDRFVTLIA